MTDLKSIGSGSGGFSSSANTSLLFKNKNIQFIDNLTDHIFLVLIHVQHSFNFLWKIMTYPTFSSNMSLCNSSFLPAIQKDFNILIHVL